MFFRKKSSETHPETVAKKSIKKMDAVVTWVILSGIVASIYGVKKLRKKEEDTHAAEHMIPHEEVVPPRKKSFLDRVFRK